MKRLLTRFALTVAAALLFVGSANAYVIDFESVDATSAPFAPLMATGDYVTQGGYFVNTQDANNNYGLLAQLSNGADPGSCLGGICPGGNTTNFLSVFNDGIAHFGKTSTDAFVFGGLSAAYIPPPDAAPGSTVYLAIEADRSDGTYAIFYYPLNGNGAFMNVGTSGGTRLGGTGLLTDGLVTDLFVYGYYCDGSTGSCSAFHTNQAQFALDDIVLNDVPEPASWLLMAAGLGTLVAIARRRRSA